MGDSAIIFAAIDKFKIILRIGRQDAQIFQSVT